MNKIDENVIKILIIEDNPGDIRLIVEMLKEANTFLFEMESADRLSTGLKLLGEKEFDIVLLDLGLPDSQGMSTVTKTVEQFPSVPLIVLTGLFSEALGLDAISKGAQEYLVKGHIESKLLARCIRYGIERKRIEESQKETEAFVKNIFESMGEGLAVIGDDLKILTANKAYCEQLNIPVKEIIGRHCYEATHGRHSPCYEAGEKCAATSTFKSGITHSSIHRHLRRDGTSFDVETNTYPVKDASGKVISIIENVKDISEKIKLEGELRHSQKMEAIGQLSGGVAHDFNNILTAIIGYATILNNNIKDNDKMNYCIEQILESSERATNLTQSLLAFSRKQIITPKVVNLNDIIKSTQKLLLRLIGENIEVRSSFKDEKLFVIADEGQLEQVLINLAVNAKDAMPRGGLLTINTEPVNLDRYFINAHGYGRIGNYVLLSVSDTGIGMHEETKKRIFEPFFTTKEVGKGTGLGLSIVYGIVKQHDGYINVYSEPGKGTTLKIYLPLIEAEKKEEQEIPLSIPVKGGSEVILVAEDDQSVRNIVVKLLEEFGYKVIEAKNGKDAVEKFFEYKDSIKLVLLDVIMPQKNGVEACEEIREAGYYPECIFMSGYSPDIVRKAGLFDENMSFISKPIRPDNLLRTVRSVLNGAKLQQT